MLNFEMLKSASQVEDIPEIFQNIKGVSMDIGGTLIKFIVYSEEEMAYGYTALCQFPDMASKIKQLLTKSERNVTISITGGGAFRFKEQLKTMYPVSTINLLDEMECIARGSILLCPAALEEFIVVNVGSGASVVRISSDRKFERLTGSCLGGGTFMGLARFLSKLPDLGYDSAIELASKGDGSHVDLLVGDIYGQEYPGIDCLKPEIVAGSFGKSIDSSNKVDDLLASLLCMIVSNLVNIGSLCSKLNHNCPVFFSGSFFRNKKGYSYIYILQPDNIYSGRIPEKIWRTLSSSSRSYRVPFSHHLYRSK